MKEEDGIDLEPGDFRVHWRYLAPWLFAGGDDGSTYPPPWDLIDEEHWDSIVFLPTDVLLKSTSYEGSTLGRMSELQSKWILVARTGLGALHERGNSPGR